MMEWTECKNCIYFDECENKEDHDGCYCGEREKLFKETDNEKHSEILKYDFDYYIKDEFSGIHTNGLGYAPDGMFCSECTREIVRDAGLKKI